MTAHTLDHHSSAADSKEIFGFWIYIMSDCILFGSLFAAYAVLHHNTFGGASIKDIASLPYILAETIFLLVSSFTFGMGMISMHKRKRGQVQFWLLVTFLFGAAFLAMELNEFAHLIAEGNGWTRSAFLSAFFTLVGTHGLHVTCGLVWIITMVVMLSKREICPMVERKLTCLGLFWHFLDIVWIFVFTIVYLLGAV